MNSIIPCFSLALIFSCQSLFSMEQLTAGTSHQSCVEGRPDAACPCWEGFIEKKEKEGKDYTVFDSSCRSKREDAGISLSVVQCAVITAIARTGDFTQLNGLSKGSAGQLSSSSDSGKWVINQLRSKPFLDVVLACLWDANFKVKAGAVYLLSQLTKEKPLPEYVYRVWGSAATEGNYTYNVEQNFNPVCQVTIRQLGINAIDATGTRMGMAHATMEPKKVAHAVCRPTMDEEWFVVGGQGEFWTETEGFEDCFEGKPGTYFSNPHGMAVQFRNTGQVPLTLLIQTTPPFDDVIKDVKDLKREFQVVPGHWGGNRGKAGC